MRIRVDLIVLNKTGVENISSKGEHDEPDTNEEEIDRIREGGSR